jgi:hypothetical protein
MRGPSCRLYEHTLEPRECQPSVSRLAGFRHRDGDFLLEAGAAAPCTGAGMRGDDQGEDRTVGAAQVAQPSSLGEAPHDHDGSQRGEQCDELMQVGQRCLAVGGTRIDVGAVSGDIPGHHVPVDVGVPG